MKENECGEWHVSNTLYGPMAHARLRVAEENSGKLVTVVRRQAKSLAEQKGIETIYIDGPPGIGCPVISSMTGVDLAVLVTEPTLSGLHDLDRITDLARQLKVRTAACVNKYDLNQEMTAKIEDYCRSGNVELVGSIPYDRSVIESLSRGEAVVHAAHSEAADAIRDAWGKVLNLCGES
jgi:MinD superfamily P-loop ATPase